MRALISRSAARLDMNASLTWRVAHTCTNTLGISQADSSVGGERYIFFRTNRFKCSSEVSTAAGLGIKS